MGASPGRRGGKGEKGGINGGGKRERGGTDLPLELISLLISSTGLQTGEKKEKKGRKAAGKEKKGKKKKKKQG